MVKFSLFLFVFSAATFSESSPHLVLKDFSLMSLFFGATKSPAIKPRAFLILHYIYRKVYDLLQAIQNHGGAGARAAVFFAATAFFLSQICVNVGILLLIRLKICS